MSPDHLPQHLLTILLFVPLLGTFFIGLMPERSAYAIASVLGMVMVVVAALLGLNFNPSYTGMQFVEQIPWIRWPFPVDYHVGIDGMSLCLIILTTIVTATAILASKNVAQNRPKLYYSLLMLLTTSIIGVFISLDLVQFFVLYELELIPMYFLIAIWGGPRREYAAMKFLIYTFLGGIFMLGGLLYLYFQTGLVGPGLQTFDMVKLAHISPFLAKGAQLGCCLAFLLAFLIKLPSFPLHTWLPDAHVEAPTPVSMILAGLLLKMGSYGLVRINLGFFPEAVGTLAAFIMALGCFNIVWAAIACLVQQDMKRIIAFSSVSHMGFVLLGLGSLSAVGLSGAVFQMISHGFISAALFFLVGVLYDRCHTRQIAEIGGGLARQMPMIFYFWMLACMANLALPGLSGFVAEVTVFYGAFTSAVAASLSHSLVRPWIIIACITVILSAGYMLWLLKRLFYGSELPKWEGHLSDATPREVLIAATLSFFMLSLGIYPMLLTNAYTPLTDKIILDLSNRHLTSLPQSHG